MRSQAHVDLGMILRGYRRASRLSQQQLADMLGYDRTYVSMIECGRRDITDRRTLTHIARVLALPLHLFGLAAPDDADFISMLQFGASTVRLATVARHSGHAALAVRELWPLVTALESRIAVGLAEPGALVLLAQAKVSLGVALGHLLPEERLASAARWTGRALRIAIHAGDRQLLAFVLRMHGNELRKARRPAAAVARLQQALQVEARGAQTGAGLILLAPRCGSSREIGLVR